MADKNTEQKIKQAFSNAVPDIRGSILSDCKSQKGAVIIMTDTNKKTFLSRRLAGIAAAFVLLPDIPHQLFRCLHRLSGRKPFH